MALNKLKMGIDSYGNPTFLRNPPSNDGINALSVGTSAETLTMPSGANYVIFSSTGDFYVRANATAAIPGDTTDGSGAELNPAGYHLNGVSSLSIIAPTAATIVTASFYI